MRGSLSRSAVVDTIVHGLRRFSGLVPLVLVLGLLAACAGGEAVGSGIEVEEAWARPSLAPIGHMDDHDHVAMHGSDGADADHMADEHDGMEAHHQSSGTTSAAYFVLRNRGGEPDRLVGASTEVAGTVELHRSSIEDGVMRMRQVESIEVPPRGEVQLAPGGYHLMLIGVKRELKDGDRFPLRLEFERAGESVVEVVVGVR